MAFVALLRMPRLVRYQLYNAGIVAEYAPQPRMQLVRGNGAVGCGNFGAD